MKESTAWKIYFGVCFLAAMFCLYGILHEGWEANRSTVYWTIGIFGFPGLMWAVINKLTQR